MNVLILIPALFFIPLLLGEFYLPTFPQKYVYHRWDWLLNIIGFFVQGLVIPISAYLLATKVLAPLCPAGKGILPLDWAGAFILNFVGVDFLYYWQHRLFHEMPLAWQWHRCHHASPRVDLWATARNSIITNFFFVYIMINPILGFLCKNPEGFFTGALVTASLDLMRHCRIDFKRIRVLKILTRLLGYIIIMPEHHHRHHNALAPTANYGANLVIWDLVFNTFCSENIVVEYKDPDAPHPFFQLLYPLK